MDRRDAIKKAGILFGGATFSAISLSSLASCQSASAPTWQPSYLSVEQGQIVRTIADILIPATETKGALDVGVPEFIDIMMRDTLDEEAQKQTKSGFEQFASKCKEVTGKSFVDCSPEEQLKFLQQLEKEDKDSEGPSFIEGIKQGVYHGYFTSEYGMTEILGFNPIPGDYLDCVPVAECTDFS